MLGPGGLLLLLLLGHPAEAALGLLERVLLLGQCLVSPGAPTALVGRGGALRRAGE